MIFAIESWYTKFPLVEVEFLPPGISDHSHISVKIKVKVKFGPKTFKFHGFWKKEGRLLELLNRARAKEQEGNLVQFFMW